MVFNRVAVTFNGKVLNIIDIDDAVRIAHGDTGDFERAIKDFQFHVDDLFVRHSNHWQVSACQAWWAHVDPDLVDVFVFIRIHGQRQDAGTGFHLDLGTIYQAVVKGVLCDATDAIAAHFCFAAIGIEHAHFHVSLFRGLNQNQPIAAHAEIPIADFARQALGIFDALPETVNVDVVVAGTVHFDEFHSRPHLAGEVSKPL